MKRVRVDANFVFVVVRAKELSVGTEYLELGAPDNYESSTCESNFVSIKRTVSCSSRGNAKRVTS